MAFTIHLSREIEVALRERATAAGVSAEDYARRVILRAIAEPDEDDSPDPTPLRRVSEEIVRRFRALPDEAFEGLPRDGASQHDHYIYGTPKRDDL